MSNPAPPADPAGAAAVKASGGLGGKIVLAVAGLNLLATTGLAAVVVLRSPAAPAPAAHEHAAVAPGEAQPAEAGHGEAAKPAATPAAKPDAKPADAEAAKPAAAEGHGEAKSAASTTGTPAATSGMNTARLEDIVVHLRNPEVDRYARLTIDVEMSSADEVKALQDNVPRVRDAVIMTLSEHTFEELRGGEGLARMKGWLRSAIDDVVPGRVTNVYVSTFLVQ